MPSSQSCKAILLKNTYFWIFLVTALSAKYLKLAHLRRIAQKPVQTLKKRSLEIREVWRLQEAENARRKILRIAGLATLCFKKMEMKCILWQSILGKVCLVLHISHSTHFLPTLHQTRQHSIAWKWHQGQEAASFGLCQPENSLVSLVTEWIAERSWMEGEELPFYLLRKLMGRGVRKVCVRVLKLQIPGVFQDISLHEKTWVEKLLGVASPSLI